MTTKTRNNGITEPLINHYVDASATTEFISKTSIDPTIRQTKTHGGVPRQTVSNARAVLMSMIKMIDCASYKVNLTIGVMNAATTAIAPLNVGMSSALIVKITVMTITTSLKPRVERKLKTEKVNEPTPSRMEKRFRYHMSRASTFAICNAKLRTKIGSDGRTRTVKLNNPKSAPKSRMPIALKGRLCAARLWIILNTVVTNNTLLFGAQKYRSRHGDTQTLY